MSQNKKSLISSLLDKEIVKRFLQSLPVILFASLLVGAIIYAWTEPSAPPPGGNVAAPINVSDAYQYKAGDLGLGSNLVVGGGFRVNSTAILMGNVGIGTPAPGAKLDVAGTVRMTGFQLGTSATAGYVLTADASGVGTWKAAAGGGIGGSGTANYIPIWTGATSLGNSVIYQSGTNVGIGTPAPSQKLDVVGNVRITGLTNCNTIDTDASGNLTCGTDEGSGTVRKSVLVKRSTGGSAAACPGGWSDGGTGVASYAVNTTYERYCFRTDAICRVMVMRSTGALPAGCPGGWSDGGTGVASYGVNATWERYCFSCP